MAGAAKKVKGVTTRNGKPVWTNDENREEYSEKTATFEYGAGYLVTPTVDPETGGNYKLNDLFDHYDENGPYDVFTGEKLPVFDDEPSAIEYSKWRSKNILNEDITDEEFYTGESGAYYPQDGSGTSFKDYIGDARDHTSEIKDDVMGFFSSDSPEAEDDRMVSNTYRLGGTPTMSDGGFLEKTPSQKMYRVDGGVIVFKGETDDSGRPLYEYVRDEQPTSNIATSIRPVARPSQEEIERLQEQYLYEEKDRLAKENWDQRDQKIVRTAGMALGGLATSQRGITTKEGLDMANNKFQLDQKKADLDEDGELSDYEMARGEAIQKANADNPENDEKMQMYHGGMPCGCEGDCDGSCMGMMSDPVSGNPIPVGSSAENVRDDIEAMISEGEYVLPANVVKWHGLKHIMDMQSEAEMGLMGMFDMGLIQYAGEEDAEEPEEVTEAEDDVPSEEVDIEVAAVKVDDMLDDDEEVEEVYPKTSKLPGMISTPKMVFMS